MKGAVLLLAVFSLTAAAPKPYGHYRQHYEFEQSSASFRNNQLQHKNEEQGRYTRLGDMDSPDKPQERSFYHQSQYNAPGSDQTQVTEQLDTGLKDHRRGQHVRHGANHRDLFKNSESQHKTLVNVGQGNHATKERSYAVSEMTHEGTADQTQTSQTGGVGDDDAVGTITQLPNISGRGGHGHHSRRYGGHGSRYHQRGHQVGHEFHGEGGHRQGTIAPGDHHQGPGGHHRESGDHHHGSGDQHHGPGDRHNGPGEHRHGPAGYHGRYHHTHHSSRNFGTFNAQDQSSKDLGLTTIDKANQDLSKITDHGFGKYYLENTERQSPKVSGSSWTTTSSWTRPQAGSQLAGSGTTFSTWSSNSASNRPSATAASSSDDSLKKYFEQIDAVAKKMNSDSQQKQETENLGRGQLDIRGGHGMQQQTSTTTTQESRGQQGYGRSQQNPKLYGQDQQTDLTQQQEDLTQQTQDLTQQTQSQDMTQQHQNRFGSLEVGSHQQTQDDFGKLEFGQQQTSRHIYEDNRQHKPQTYVQHMQTNKFNVQDDKQQDLTQQQTQDDFDKIEVEDVTRQQQQQQSHSSSGKLELDVHHVDLTQLTQNRFGKLELGQDQVSQQQQHQQHKDLTQQPEDLTHQKTQRGFGKLEFGQDQTQSTHIHEEKLNLQQHQQMTQQHEDLTQDAFDTLESGNQQRADFTQQHGDMTQQTHDGFGALESGNEQRGDLTQQHGDMTQQTHDGFGTLKSDNQQRANFNQQYEDLTQQTQDGSGTLEFGNQQRGDLTQQTQNRFGTFEVGSQYKHKSDKIEDLTQQLADFTQQHEGLAQQSKDGNVEFSRGYGGHGMRYHHREYHGHQVGDELSGEDGHRQGSFGPGDHHHGRDDHHQGFGDCTHGSGDHHHGRGHHHHGPGEDRHRPKGYHGHHSSRNFGNAQGQSNKDQGLTTIDNANQDLSKFTVHGFGKDYLENTERQNQTVSGSSWTTSSWRRPPVGSQLAGSGTTSYTWSSNSASNRPSVSSDDSLKKYFEQIDALAKEMNSDSQQKQETENLGRGQLDIRAGHKMQQ